MDLLNKPLGEVTVGELLRAFMLATPPPEPEQPPEREYAYGIKGLATILHCGQTKAQSIKNTGYLDGAFYQTGRKLTINVQKARELYEKNRHLIEKTRK